MADLNGHEGGNAGDSQGKPKGRAEDDDRPRRGWREGGRPRGMRDRKTRSGRRAGWACPVRGTA